MLVPMNPIFQDANCKAEIKFIPLSEASEPRLSICYSVYSMNLTTKNNLGKMNKEFIYLGRKVEILKPRLLALIKMKPN